MAVCLISIFEDEGSGLLCGYMLGSKNIQRIQKNTGGMMIELGSCTKRAYKSSLETFYKRHGDILPFLKAEFEEKFENELEEGRKKEVVTQMVKFIQSFDC